VICFGDGKNDLSMFALADECYAVENAAEELKAIATGIIDCNDQDGVAKWLLAQFEKTRF
jgi:hydroxymethylpyrimidine pyrophosphatase-like HAD family hydrolase